MLQEWLLRMQSNVHKGHQDCWDMLDNCFQRPPVKSRVLEIVDVIPHYLCRRKADVQESKVQLRSTE